MTDKTTQEQRKAASKTTESFRSRLLSILNQKTPSKTQVASPEANPLNEESFTETLERMGNSLEESKITDEELLEEIRLGREETIEEARKNEKPSYYRQLHTITYISTNISYVVS